MPGEAGYFAADAEAQDELTRLQAIEAECDPHTFRYLDAVGVCEGWKCLEVGAGGGSVVRWLSRRVGPTGTVVAADIDPRFLSDLREPNVEVRRCDITRDEIEPASYDVVHTRLLLMHLADPGDVLRRMAAALRPGGWLIAEEPDLAVVESADTNHPLAEVFDRCFHKMIEFYSATGILDARFGRALPVCMEKLGLVEMGNEGITRVFHGGHPLARAGSQSWQHMFGILIDNGVLTDSEAADIRRAYDDPTFVWRNQLMQSVWGRRP